MRRIAGKSIVQGTDHGHAPHPVPTLAVVAELLAAYGSGRQCERTLEAACWPEGFISVRARASAIAFSTANTRSIGSARAGAARAACRDGVRAQPIAVEDPLPPQPALSP